MSEEMECPICNKTASPAAPYRGGSYKLNCVQCGLFEIGDIATGEITTWERRQRTNLSGWIREHPGCKILSPGLKDLSTLASPTVGEKAMKLLERFAFESQKPGDLIDITTVALRQQNAEISSTLKSGVFHRSPRDNGWKGIVRDEYLAWSWSQDFEELAYLIQDYLIAEVGALAITREGDLRITPKGWAQIDARRQGNPTSKIGFIAMWFSDSVDNARSAIDQGIRAAGYEPFRVDQKEHNNDITDEIIAGIRGSKFLVADLTGHRNGVYYEAGFAKGLGLDVVWLCRKSDEKDRHFDIRQLNCIFWEDDKMPQLAEALKNRIVATIGRGPLQ